LRGATTTSCAFRFAGRRTARFGFGFGFGFDFLASLAAALSASHFRRRSHHRH
jgi:hypothetical protein